MKVAIITGVTCYVGKKLCESLLQNEYEVHGITKCNINLPEGHKNLHIYNTDVNDYLSILDFLKTFQKLPQTEIYHFHGFDLFLETDTENITRCVVSTIYILQCIKLLKMETKIKFFQPHSTKIFGDVQEIPQKEITDFHPDNIHGICHLSTYWIVKYYRKKYNLFACNCIIYNVEGPSKPDRALSTQISRCIGHSKHILQVGNLDSSRDWVYITDLLECVEKIMRYNESEDVIISSFESHTIREYIEIAFKQNDINIKWVGKGETEKGYNEKTKKLLVEVNTNLLKSDESNYLLGNNEKALRLYDWKPKIEFTEMISYVVPKKTKKDNIFFSCC